MLRQISRLCTSLSHLSTVKNNHALSVRSVHLYPSLCSQHKDIKSDIRSRKTDHYRKATTEFELDSSISDIRPEAEGEIEDLTKPIGVTEYGFTCPTLESHDQLWNGIPYRELPIVHIKCSPNNTLIAITDHTGRKILSRTSCGTEGFKNAKKKTNVACQATGLSAGQRALKLGLHTVRISIKGVGGGRLAAIKGVHTSGLKIVSLTDTTPIAHAGPRPRKARRV